MEKLKIAIALIGGNDASKDFLRQVCDDPTMLELCSPAFLNEEEAYRRLDKEEADALVLYSSTEPTKHPSQSIEIIAKGKNYFMPLPKEPTAEDIIKFRDILERDFDRQLPRIAIVRESAMENPNLASQVTTEQGINTYGPYTAEQILSEDIACHFDGIIIPEGNTLPTDQPEEPSARFFAGLKTVITATQQAVPKEETEEGLSDISALTKPIYMAIDIVRNRIFYDEARQSPLPKLFRDKREDKKKDDAPQANNNDNTEKAS